VLVAMAGASACWSSGGVASGSAAVGNAAPTTTAVPPTTTGYFVYWDQNEEEDYLHVPSGESAHLIPPWDPNGQMCTLNDGSGRFVVGYNPTMPSQHNPGSLKPYKDPPVGEALYDRFGDFTGTNLFVAGPYHLPGGSVGEDIPPDANNPSEFNNNGTFTGCAVDKHNNVFATDIGTAQGAFPVPDNGRLIEWFAPDYTTACVVDGPTAGGVGPHHVDGTGGLKEPGMMAVDRNGDLLLPEAGAGRVLRIDHKSLPKHAKDCPGDLYPTNKLRTSDFISGGLAFPIGVARDSICNCWAVDSVIGDPAVAFFDDTGHQLSRPTIPGTPLGDPNGYSPFGLAFAPDGTLYFVDIHIECANNQISNCGPANNGGRIMKVTFTGDTPSPPTAIRTGYNFPTSVTVCVPSKQPHRLCPEPAGGLGTDGSGGTGPGTGLGGAPTDTGTGG
jgi:hypothetical protein